MNYTQHPSNNAVFGAPKGWDQAEMPVGALPITITQDSMVSFWRPTPEELAQLNNGGLVALHVMGRTHPVVALSVQA